LKRGKNRLRGKRRRRIFLQRSNRGKHRSGREGEKGQGSQMKVRFDRGNIIFYGRE
jgi:hypothetical protein